MESAIGRLRSRKKLPCNPQQADTSEVPERRVLRILSRLKQQNYGEGLGRGEFSAFLPAWPLPGPPAATPRYCATWLPTSGLPVGGSQRAANRSSTSSSLTGAPCALPPRP